MAKPLSPEMKSLNKKFIPANIIICIIAFVAGICMILMPWVDVRIHIEGEKLAEFMSDSSTSTAEVSPTKTFDSSDEGVVQEGLIMGSLKEALSEFSIDIPINLYPTKMMKAASGDKKEIEEMFNSIIGKQGAEKFLGDFVNELAPVVLKASLNASIEQMFLELRGELSEEDYALILRYKQIVTDAINSIQQDPSEENARTQLNLVSETILAENAEDITEDDIKIVRNIVNEIVRQGSNNGKFDYVYLFKNLDIDALDSIANESNPNETPSMGATSIGSTNSFAVAYEGEGDSEESENPFAAMIELLENPGALIAENLDEQTIQSLNSAFMAISIVFVGIPAGLCFMLALFAIIRIFTEKKRVRFWYVKILLFVSAMTIIMLNIMTSVIMPSIIASLDMGAQVESLFSAFSIKFLGSGVVNAICWLALTIVSLFYYRRVKKQIKIQKQVERQNPQLKVA